MPYQIPNENLDGGGRRTLSCAVCGSPANLVPNDVFEGDYFDCVRCGDFAITEYAKALCARDIKTDKQKALASHLIRKMQGGQRPILRQDFFSELNNRKLPDPAEATDNLLLWLARQADGRPGAIVEFDTGNEALLASIGVVDILDARWAANNLAELGLTIIKPAGSDFCYKASVTGKGWLRLDEISRAHISSRYAFFARRFVNGDLDNVVDNCLKAAVAETGYELRIVTQKAGLIDSTIENEIRRCRFLVADLSDDNAGAYWEAGLAEGLGKPVIYICREKDLVDPAKEKKTHFDTEHRLTIRWDPDPATFVETATKLKALIRNTLLGDATQES
jgi:nucleoside 2-deoxyribosyltransferase